MPYNIIIGRDEKDKKNLGEKGLIFIGKNYVKMGQYTSLSNNILMDVSRSHVVLVAGKRGCLTGDSFVFTNKGYKKIAEFDEKKDKILSFNKEKEKLEWETAKLLEYPINNEELLEIELIDGRLIKLTKEHPLLSSYGKYKFYKRACDLKVKDKIVVPTILPEIKKDSESLRIARLLGYILADGTINIRNGKFKDGRGYWYNGTKARIRINNACDEVLKQAKEDFEKEFKIIVKRYKRNDCNCEIVETKQQKIAKKFIDLGIPKGLKSHLIEIPNVVFQSSNKFKSEFIKALFDCDGYIDKKCKTIDYSSKSRKFLEQLQILLTHFKIESVIRNKNSKCNGKICPNFRLFITDNISIENYKKIGFDNPFKKERLLTHKPYNTRKRKTYYPSENLVCIKIKKISKIAGIKKVYDLTVDKNHSFVTNGIISHNSGKSYTLGTIAEELSNLPKEIGNNIASLIFDTMGIYWTMKFKNEKDKELLSKWKLKSKQFPVKVFVPFGYYDEYIEKNIPVDKKFALDVSELSSEDWLITFELKRNDPISLLIEKTISDLSIEGDYNLDDIINTIKKDKKNNQEIKNSAINLFESVKTWKIFSENKKQATSFEELISAGKTSIIDLSVYNSIGAFNIRALVIDLVSRKIFNKRVLERKKEEIDSIINRFDYFKDNSKKENPLVWIFIDEAHEFLPLNKKTIATDALIQLLREGRQPGISLVLATQQPGQIHRDVMTQSDIVISHKVTSQSDIEALNYIMQSYLLEDIKKYLNDLPKLKGSAIILDDNSERIYPIQIKPRLTWHGGEAPTIINSERKI
jgi:uncharacterized protein